MLEILQYATSDLFVFIGCFLLTALVFKGMVAVIESLVLVVKALRDR